MGHDHRGALIGVEKIAQQRADGWCPGDVECRHRLIKQ